MTDSNEPTAWEEINPVTVSAPQPAPPVMYSGLQPATREQFGVELTACLVLVAPVGMTEEARREWLSVAWQTLRHLPSDLLAAGCIEARKTADHPCKIVPTITEYAEPRYRDRKRINREYPIDVPRLERPDPNYCSPEEARQILKEFGLASNPVAPEGAPHD